MKYLAFFICCALIPFLLLPLIEPKQGKDEKLDRKLFQASVAEVMQAHGGQISKEEVASRAAVFPSLWAGIKWVVTPRAMAMALLFAIIGTLPLFLQTIYTETPEVRSRAAGIASIAAFVLSFAFLSNLALSYITKVGPPPFSFAQGVANLASFGAFSGESILARIFSFALFIFVCLPAIPGGAKTIYLAVQGAGVVRLGFGLVTSFARDSPAAPGLALTNGDIFNTPQMLEVVGLGLVVAVPCVLLVTWFYMNLNSTLQAILIRLAAYFVGALGCMVPAMALAAYPMIKMLGEIPA